MIQHPVKPGRIFVYGSNDAGRHGLGAALFAKQYFGAVYGIGRGLQGHSYGIITKYEVPKTRCLLPCNLKDIKENIKEFLEFAAEDNLAEFHVTRIACGLAGKRNEEIAPMFIGASLNCFFDPLWLPWGLQSYDWVKEQDELVLPKEKIN